jgi:hypothetical protein
MWMTTLRHAPLALLGVLACASCSSTRTSVTQVWQAQVATAPMKHVLVIGARLDEATRRVLEDGFVAELAKHGVFARRSYELFPGELPDRETARPLVEEKGFEGILVATLKNVGKTETVVSTSRATRFWSSYGSMGYPGYVVTEPIVNFETTLWDSRQEDTLGWAALTKTASPSSDRDFVKSLTETVVSSLVEARLVPPQTK